MTTRVATTLAIGLAALGVGSAAAGAAGRTTTVAAAPADVTLQECHTSDHADDRMAAFHGRMHAIPGSDRMQMRFALFQQFGIDRFERVDAPALRAWRRSGRGVARYGYTQTVTGLAEGGQYRVAVHFRWLDGDGRVIRDLVRRSAPCRQPGELPNLRVASVTAKPGPSDGTEQYTVNVINNGRAAAGKIGVSLRVDGATLDAASIDAIAAGETRPVKFNGPACKSRIRAAVDPGDAVHQITQRDDVTAGGCPPVLR